MIINCGVIVVVGVGCVVVCGVCADIDDVVVVVVDVGCVCFFF